MNGDRSERALARIEAALARIEVAARKPRSLGDDGDLTRLAGRHERLRAAATEALAQLDTILEGPRG
jgi:hypothetical protein